MKKFDLTVEQAMERVHQIRGRKPRRPKQLAVLAEYQKLLR